MGFMCDYVTAGDYKGADIKIKGLKQNKVVLVKKGILGKSEIALEKGTVESVNIMNQNNLASGSTFQVEIIFKNGKKSLAVLTDMAYRKLISVLY